MASVNFKSLKLVKGGVIGGTDKAAGSVNTILTYYSFGDSSSDLWGQTWTASDINATSFGVAVAFEGTGFLAANYISHYLKVTDFGFTVPASAIVDGIKVEVKANSAEVSSVTSAQVDAIRITVCYTVVTATEYYTGAISLKKQLNKLGF